MKWIDLPPVWLAFCLVVVWAVPVRDLPDSWAVLGWIILALAVALVLLAGLAFMRARTTIIPRLDPAALITNGIFAYSRNPIYLADVLILLGCALIWGSWLGLVLVPVLALILDRRFIAGEEAKLSAHFGAEFEAYRAKVRRWI